MFYSSAGNWHQKLEPATGTRKLVSVYGLLIIYLLTYRLYCVGLVTQLSCQSVTLSLMLVEFIILTVIVTIIIRGTISSSCDVVTVVNSVLILSVSTSCFDSARLPVAYHSQQTSEL